MYQWILKKIREDKKGFTLVELVAVIAILGILAAIAVPRFTGSTKKAAISAHNANVRTLESAANMFIADKGVPTDEKGVTWTKDSKDEDNGWGDYLQEWPEVPKGTGVKYKDSSGTEKNIDETDYEVIIGTDGSITVVPGKAIE